MRVLCLADYYLPGHRAGGPVRSLSSLVHALSSRVAFSIVTRNRDLQLDHPYPGITASTWVTLGPARVWYAPPWAAPAQVLRLLREERYDLLYLNSFFSPTFSVLPMLARHSGACPRRPVLVAPRGELAGPALELGAGRKRAYLRLARSMGLYGDAWFHAATGAELTCIEEALSVPSARIGVAANAYAPVQQATALATVLEEPAFAGSAAREAGPMRAVFLSRVSPIKHLEFLIDALHGVTVPMELHVYGPIHDPAYWRACQRRAATLPPHIRFLYHGPVPHDQVSQVFAQHDVFLFPSRSESFGHVIGESLRAGTPVLTSPHTPWQPDGGGALEVVPIEDAVVWTQAVQRWAELSVSTRAQLSREALRVGNVLPGSGDAVAATHALFERAWRGNAANSR